MDINCYILLTLHDSTFNCKITEMETEISGKGQLRTTRNELITIQDLTEFKLQLLEEFKILIRSNTVQAQKRWLKTNEIMKLLGMSAGTLQTLRMNGTLPYTKIGGVVYFDVEDIEQVFKNQKVSKSR